MTLKNITRNTVLASDLEMADTAGRRMKGLLGRSNLPDGHGLMIVPCQSVHMLFMKFGIDVIFLDQGHKAVGLCRNLKPFQFSPIFFNSCCAVELPAGKIDGTQTRLGDTLSWESSTN